MCGFIYIGVHTILDGSYKGHHTKTYTQGKEEEKIPAPVTDQVFSGKGDEGGKLHPNLG
jgi:hypothetical protein